MWGTDMAGVLMMAIASVCASANPLDSFLPPVPGSATGGELDLVPVAGVDECASKCLANRLVRCVDPKMVPCSSVVHAVHPMQSTKLLHACALWPWLKQMLVLAIVARADAEKI